MYCIWDKFPSHSKNLFYNAVMKSEIEWANLYYIEATLYIALNWTEEQKSPPKETLQQGDQTRCKRDRSIWTNKR